MLSDRTLKSIFNSFALRAESTRQFRLVGEDFEYPRKYTVESEDYVHIHICAHMSPINKEVNNKIA